MNDRIFDLVEQWEIARNEGQILTPEMLCQECPELLPEVARRIRALAATAWMENSAVADAELLEPPLRQVGRYELIELIGAGGFAEVFRCTSTVTNCNWWTYSLF
ncbi:hypothetical protein SH661x_002645 [Planctomicrobium sp. SH661]|uniref:hypothetical protein n=1 Tax=Planctomicrobium sp. SH661 TaxID=3448124 RepID=UPI003F5CA5CB